MGPAQSVQEVLREYNRIADSYRENPDQIFSNQPLLSKINDELLFEVGERVTQETRESYDELITFFGESCKFM